MNALLAQISTDMLGPIAPWLISASAVLFLVNQGITFYKDHFRESPIPADTYATKKELHETHGRISRERKEIDAALTRADAEIKALAEGLQDAVGQIRRDGEARVSALGAHIDDLKKEIKEENSDLHTRITEMLTSFSGFKGRVEEALKHR